MVGDLIHLQQVYKSFDREHSWALGDVSLGVKQGQFLAIIGASGSGKTTLLKSINRLIDVDRGVVSISGEPIDAVPAHILRRRMGYVFQRIGLFPHLSVSENIGIAPSLLGWHAAEIARRVEELLDLLGLPRAFRDRMPAQLSGGQQQRVGIARALAARPTIMLMDEPFSALDAITRDALATEYRRLHAEMGLTTVMSTHDVMEAVLLADRIVVMGEGRLLADAAPHALLAGQADAAVAALMAMPRRQAERVRLLLAGRSADG